MKTILKDKIIEILMLETFNTSDEAGNNYIVIEDCDFNKIADKIVKLFAISDVSISYCDCAFPKPDENDNYICKKCKCKI